MVNPLVLAHPVSAHKLARSQPLALRVQGQHLTAQMLTNRVQQDRILRLVQPQIAPIAQHLSVHMGTSPGRTGLFQARDNSRRVLLHGRLIRLLTLRLQHLLLILG